MDIAREKLVRGAMEEFAGPANVPSAIAFLADAALYIGAVVIAVLAEPIWVKVAAVIIAGTATSMLFILGHDAAHMSLFSSRRANAIFGRVMFLPCLHNYTLWVIQHNRLHHQSTNVRGLNSFSPLSVDEFNSLPAWRRGIERLYRSVPGFGAYYLIERWWKDKFFPRSGTPAVKARVARRDLALLLTWLAVFCGFLVWLDATFVHEAPAMAIVWGFLAPFLVWNALMGMTAWLQHTSPHIPWFRSVAESRLVKTQAELATFIRYPRWYDFISHNIMHHPAHHVNARISWYRLSVAQRHLDLILETDAIGAPIGPKYVLGLTRQCQLYDYERHQWLDFAGRPTTETTSDDHARALAPHAD